MATKNTRLYIAERQFGLRGMDGNLRVPGNTPIDYAGFPKGEDPASGKPVAADRATPGYADNLSFRERIIALLAKLRAALPDVTFESDYED